MPDINIPGVSDKYKTNDLVKSLIEVEKIPLNREKEKLEAYKSEQENWRRVNQQMSSLREAARTLYSFDNPFNDKNAVSSNEAAVTAEAKRGAAVESFKIDVIRTASADRFLSDSIEKNAAVPAGTYTFTVADKSVSFTWKGGKLSDFTSALNRRSNNIVKASIIGVSGTSQSLLIESLKTGKENKLIFSDDALDYALSINMLQPARPGIISFGTKTAELTQTNSLTMNGIYIDKEYVSVPPENGYSVELPKSVKGNRSQIVEFTASAASVPDITVEYNKQSFEPVIPSAGFAEFKGIVIQNISSETTLPPPDPIEPRQPVSDPNVFFIQNADGSKIKLPGISFSEKPQTFSFSIEDYPLAESVAVVNSNTGVKLNVSSMRAYDSKTQGGYEPINPVSTAADARIKYEGIEITRPENKIDDIVPEVTLTLTGVTEKPASIEIKPNIEAAKEALITFTGKYNQLMAELNILTQNKPEIVSELEYFSDDEKDSALKRLGSLQSDFSLTANRSALQRIMTNPYKANESSMITMLNQLGIAAKGSGNSGFSSSQLRGYLDIDEKKLDQALKDNIDAAKDLFGFDTNGDLIIDNGIAYQLDQNLQSYVRTGGIIASKTNSIDSKIKSSEAAIKKFETQLGVKEQDLRRKYGQMESTLNSLESQKSTISNFNKQSSQ